MATRSGVTALSAAAIATESFPTTFSRQTTDLTALGDGDEETADAAAVEARLNHSLQPVSYTHLDVYKRQALWDGILIKENHIAAAGGIAQALQAAQALRAGVTLQIEVEDLDELQQALEAGAHNVMLDDFKLEDMRHACAMNAGRAVLEVSGGVDLDSIRRIAATGVDRVSVGKLTKDCLLYTSQDPAGCGRWR